MSKGLGLIDNAKNLKLKDLISWYYYYSVSVVGNKRLQINRLICIKVIYFEYFIYYTLVHIRAHYPN